MILLIWDSLFPIIPMVFIHTRAFTIYVCISADLEIKHKIRNSSVKRVGSSIKENNPSFTVIRRPSKSYWVSMEAKSDHDHQLVRKNLRKKNNNEVSLEAYGTHTTRRSNINTMNNNRAHMAFWQWVLNPIARVQRTWLAQPQPQQQRSHKQQLWIWQFNVDAWKNDW